MENSIAKLILMKLWHGWCGKSHCCMENQLNLYVLQSKYTNEGKNPVTDMTDWLY